MRTEKQLQVYTKKQAKKLGIGFYKLECAGQTGFPDVLLVSKGWCVFIELKSPAGTGVLSPRQEIVLNDLTNHGLETYVIKNPNEIESLMQDIAKREPRDSDNQTI